MARILIVDDSPSQLMGIRRIVEKLGHEALTAEDGAAGVEVAARAAGPDPDGLVRPNNGLQPRVRSTATGHRAHPGYCTTKDQEPIAFGQRQAQGLYHQALIERNVRIVGQLLATAPQPPDPLHRFVGRL